MRDVRRPLAFVSACAMVAGTVVLATAGAAAAGTCSSKTGGSSDTLMWTGSEYTCAYVATNGNNSIGAFNTETYTSNTASGYVKRFKCQRNSGGVSISSVYFDGGGGAVGSSITFTATNTEDGGRHWTGAVLWNTSQQGSAATNQYAGDCDGYTIESILVRRATISMSGPTSVSSGGTASYTVSVGAPDGGGTPTGTVVLFRQASSSARNTPSKNCSGQSTTTGTPDSAIASATLSNGTATLTTPALANGTYKLYATYGGMPATSSGLPSYCLTPPQSGLTGAVLETSQTLTVGTSAASTGGTSAAADTGSTASQPKRRSPRLRVVDRSAEAPNPIRARCPSGFRPLQVSVQSPTAKLSGNDVGETASGAHLDTDAAPDGTEVTLQVVCRPGGAHAIKVGGAGYGSTHADALGTGRYGGLLLGGIGDDRLRLRGRSSSAFGGPDDDLIVLRKGGAGSAGPGDDLVRATSHRRSLLVGGTGSDLLVGGLGRTLINARDGAGTDEVVCRSRRTLVLADSHDHLVGPCKTVSS